MSWETVVLERDALYTRVWTEPVQQVAKRYGMSGTGLSKICHKLDVPLPPRGSWARKEAGQKVSQPPLPRLARDTPTEHRFLVHRSEFGPEHFDPAVVSAIESERQGGSKILVQEELSSPHPLVKASAPLLRKSLMKVRAEVLPASRCLDVVVSRDQVGRALRIMDALIKALEARGLEIEVTEPTQGSHGAPRMGYGSPSPTPSQTRARVEAERRAQEAERLRKLEVARVKDLDDRLNAWATASAIETLAREIERVHATGTPSNWLAWARQHAEMLRQRATAPPGEVEP